MGKSRLLDWDPAVRVRRMFTPSTDGDTFIESSKQNITERLAINKALQNEDVSWGEGRRVASVPITVWEKLIRDGIANDQKKLKVWLNDPDNRAFRTKLGLV